MQLLNPTTVLVAFAIFSRCYAQDSVCTLSPDPGPCDGTFERYFYNKDTGSCEEFLWGGCDGNGNKFVTLEECEKTCADVCQLPKASQSCAKPERRWYYNKDKKRCEKFGEGECPTNGNGFERQELCENRCIRPCWQPKKPGPCEALHKRYYYNKATRKCERFNWGGCQENSNNFLTKKECEDTCEGICHQEKKVGPCEALIPRYYYDKDTHQCEPFLWGGCEPNDNNFLTEDECEAFCECL